MLGLDTVYFTLLLLRCSGLRKLRNLRHFCNARLRKIRNFALHLGRQHLAPFKLPRRAVRALEAGNPEKTLLFEKYVFDAKSDEK